MLRNCFLPDVPLYIIPFDDENNQVRKIIAREEQVCLIDADSRIDEIGKKIYNNEEYRSYIPAWRYFRKLNAFAGHKEPFMFLDLNAVLLADPRSFFDFKELDKDIIAFGTTSAKKRTIPHEYVSNFLENLHAGSGNGFNAALFFANAAFLDIKDLQALVNPRLRKLLGKAPEQGMLSIYCGFFSKNPTTLSNYNPSVADLSGPNNFDIANDGQNLNFMSGPFRNKSILVLKNTGQGFKELPEIVSNYIKLCESS